jgi:lipopolysaccharide export system permease protein
MKVLQRYFASEIRRSVLFVMLALLALFSFFDLMGEVQSINRGGYQLQHALLYVLLGMPGYIYEFMPIAVLIGTIFVLAQFASNSEFTIMRAASMSTVMAARILFKIGLIFVVLTFVFGELISPFTSRLAERVKLSAMGTPLTQEFRTGLWTKDLLKADGLTGKIIGSRFMNVKEILPSRQLRGLTLYEFDTDFRLVKEIAAQRAEFVGNSTWRFFDVTETNFPRSLSENDLASVSGKTMPSKDIISEITPNILSVLFVDPERMSAYDLAVYTKHLADNKQGTERYEIAFWKKMTYPFAVLVMMALALPFAYLHFRAGGISLKIFSGIMLGMCFYLVNSLFSHLGLLNTWPALVTALIPSGLFLAIAVSSLWMIERK